MDDDMLADLERCNRLVKRFSMFDTDGKGYINIDTLCAGYDRSGAEYDRAAVEEIVNKFGNDEACTGSAILDFSDFEELATAAQEPECWPSYYDALVMLNTVLEILDTTFLGSEQRFWDRIEGGDGHISCENLLRIAEEMRQLGDDEPVPLSELEAELGRTISAFDDDCTGTLNFDQFSCAVQTVQPPDSYDSEHTHFHEILSFMNGAQRSDVALSRDSIGPAFRAFDDDCTGTCSEGNLMDAFARANIKNAEGLCMAVIGQFDTGRCGYLSEDAFHAAAASYNAGGLRHAGWLAALQETLRCGDDCEFDDE